MSGVTEWRDLATSSDPLARMMALKRQELVQSMMLGARDGVPVFSDPQTSALCLGPPRTAGKSTAHLIPAIWGHSGGCVSVSTKLDVAEATALAQATKGELLHYAPDGSPCPPGFKELRFSPTTGCADWGTAVKMADALLRASGAAEMKGDNSFFFSQRASSFLAAILHYADCLDLPMDYVVDMVLDADIENLKKIRDKLRASDIFSPRSARALNGIVELAPNTRSSIFATASVLLKVFELPGVTATTLNPNFDPATEFRKEHPPTVYVTSPSRTQELCAPMVVGLVTAIQDAIYDRARDDTLADTSHPPVLFAIDELSLVPLPSLPNILADGGSNGILLFCCTQDMGQINKKWKEADAFPTLFGSLVVPRGIRDKHTLDLLSALGGEMDVPKWGGTQRKGKWWQPRGFERQMSWNRQPRLPASAISEGDPNDPDRALIFTPGGGWGHIWGQFYFRSGYWPLVMYRTAICALREPGIRERGLPLPELARDGDTRHLDALGIGGQYLKLVEHYGRERHGQG